MTFFIIASSIPFNLFLNFNRSCTKYLSWTRILVAPIYIKIYKALLKSHFWFRACSADASVWHIWVREMRQQLGRLGLSDVPQTPSGCVWHYRQTLHWLLGRRTRGTLVALGHGLNRVRSVRRPLPGQGQAAVGSVENGLHSGQIFRKHSLKLCKSKNWVFKC